MKAIFKVIFYSFVGLLLPNCRKELPQVPHEVELITTVIWTLSPDAGGEEVVFRWDDPDGWQGDDPIVEEGILKAHTTYTASLTCINSAVIPPQDLTLEIHEEGEAHQLFYHKGGDLQLNIVYNDMDLEGYPIGLDTQVTTGAGTSGTLEIILRHEPDKSAIGVSAGEIAHAGGETDIALTFNVEIE